MGARGVVAGLSPVAAVGLGINEAYKGRKMAQREADAQRSFQREQSNLMKSELAKKAEQESKLQRKVQKEQMRSSRGRIRGGLFGDAENTGTIRPTLG